MRFALPRWLAPLLVTCVGAGAAADTLYPRSGRKVEGAIVSEGPEGVVLNLYWSRNPGVTNPEHLVRLAPDQVKKVERTPRPEVETWRRLEAADPEDAAALAAIGEYARGHKLKAAARVAFALALRADAAQPVALKGIGGRSAYEAERRGNPWLDPALAEGLAAYARLAGVEERRAKARELQGLGLAWKPYELERLRRSALEPTGLQEDRPLAWQAEPLPGAVYTLFVPPAYTPARTWPLLIGLHGGGPDGKNGDEVVGSGPSAMNFYRDLAGRRGVIVACPTALVAGWQASVNEALVRAVLREVPLRYHVDLDRVHLTGHSMGGFGTWALGPRLCEELASIAPMAGGGGSNLARLLETRTPIFIFHGADDAVVGPASDRAAARSLLGSGHDFVYTELDGVGHGFPASVQEELFDFIAPRRRTGKGARDAWPRSSFLGKPTKEEREFLGDPLGAWDGAAPGLAEWLERLARGGGGAFEAARWLAEHRPEGAAAAVAKLAVNARLPFDARAFALRALAGLGDAEGAGAARRALGGEPTRDESRVVVEAARTLVALSDPGGAPALLKAVEAWCGFLESKDLGGRKVRYSDWARAAGVLGELVEALAAIAPPETRWSALEKAVVARVLAPGWQVETSDRVPQDPGTLRRRLAAAVAATYRRLGAGPEALDALKAALAGDAAAQAAIGSP